MTSHFWDLGSGNDKGLEGDESSNSDVAKEIATGVRGDHIATIVETNFFSCREVTNCEFIYEQSDKNTNRGGFMSAFGKLFRG